MVFNKNINGYDNEREFVRYFNDKKIMSFDIETIEFLRSIFGNVDDNARVKCWRVPGYTKVDIRIEINDIIKNISIKKGVKNEIHTETLDNLIEFLTKLDISNNSLNGLRRYIYADGTENGTGHNRLSIKEYKISNQKIIDEINKEFNNIEIIEKVIDRFIMKGRISDLQIDAIIYGVTDDYIWITKGEIKQIILSKINEYSTALHFSVLTIQSWDRNLKRNEKYEYRRNYVQLKWYNISDDIIETMAFIRNK